MRRPPVRRSTAAGFRRTTISIPADVYARFLKHCEKERVTISAFLTDAGDKIVKQTKHREA